MANYASQCFPARNLLRFKKNLHTDGGAWLVAYKEEQKRRFEAVLCPEKRGSDSQRNGKSRSNELLGNQANLHHSELSGMYILKELNVDDPSDIASINIIGKGLIMAKNEDFVLFDNVEHIEAGENHLTMDSFKTFPMLRDLELQLNNVTLINMDTNDFPHLEVLDLSYNSITEDDFLNLGMLPMLKRLHLTGNGLKQLPLLLSRTKITPKQLVRTLEKSSRKSLFELLEVLDLDENEFSDNTVFFSLASLPRLKILNLSKNCLHSVPHLHFENEGLNIAPTVHLYQQQNDNLPKYSDNPADEESGQLTLRCEDEPAEKTENEIDPLAFIFDGGEESLHDFHFESAAHNNELEDQPNTNIKEPNDRELSSGESLDLQRRAYYQYPFIHLQKLDISHNSVEAEDALLPLAAWPNLMEVNMWENPLTRNCKGAPPILHHQLSKLCGIKLNRMKTTTGKKPPVGPAIAPAVRYNKVNDMPVIKRSNLLMLEFESYEAALQNGSLYGKPLPPIGSDRNDIDSLHRRDAHSAPAITNCKHTNVSKACSKERPNSIGHEQFIFQRSGKSYSGEFEDKEKSAGDKPSEKDGVFLTQVDPQDDGSAVNEIEDENYAEPHPVTQTGGPIQPLLLEEKKYIEYKELLKIEGSMEKIETPSSDDIRSNIKALQHALRHPLVFTDPSTGDSERQTYTQHQTRSITSKNQGKDSKIQSVIENMKGRSNIIEENLDFVLERYETDPQIRKQFPEVKKLLNEVQFKYNNVRLRSLETASNAQKLLKTSTKHAKNRSTDKCIASRNLQKEPVARQLKRETNSTNEREINAGSSTHLFNSNNDVNQTMTQFKAMLDKRI